MRKSLLTFAYFFCYMLDGLLYASTFEQDYGYDCEGWIKIHPYNMFCSYGTLKKNSRGMIYFVATDFNPLKQNKLFNHRNRKDSTTLLMK